MNRGAASVGWAWLIALVACTVCGCRGEQENTPNGTEGPAESTAELVARVGPQVEQFCGDCHAVPSPSSFPRSDWYREVRQGFLFYFESGRSDLDEPKLDEVVAWYQRQASEQLTFQPIARSESALTFRAEHLRLPDGTSNAAVSSVLWSEPRAGLHELLFSDMNNGSVQRLTWNNNRLGATLIGSTNNPAHVEPTDLDSDGRTDYLVADLGSFMPDDHTRGRVVWLNWDDERERYRPITLLDGVGRVADARPGDFNGDGKTDVLVAEFGWRETGSLRVLLQREMRDSVPSFDELTIDDRHGTIHVPPLDWNGDGTLDFVALISQEHETVELFLNRGDGQFDRETIFSAPGPSYGSSGIQVVDMDGDSDLDVLLSNGDSLDSLLLKPYHAISWLENRGGFPFLQHELTPMPGVYRAVAGDLDGDGDMDVAAGAFVPPELLRDMPTGQLDTLIWLEQTADGTFLYHAIPSTTGHMALDVGDLDADGDLDLIVGNFAMSVSDWLSVYWNQLEPGTP